MSADNAELAALLSSNPAAAQLYADHCLLHADLHLAHVSSRALLTIREAIEAESNQQAALSDQQAGGREQGSGVTTPSTPFTPRQRSAADRFVSRHNLGIAVCVAMVAALVVVGWSAVTYLPGLVERDEVEQPAAKPEKKPFVAWFKAEHNAKWLEGTRPRNTRLWPGKRLAISEGLLEIEYLTGAKVVLEGPATYIVGGSPGGSDPVGNALRGVPRSGMDTANQSPERRRGRSLQNDPTNSGYLARGRLVARCNTPESKGFTVDTPHVRIVDLGTEFGVDVQEGDVAQVDTTRRRSTRCRGSGRI